MAGKLHEQPLKGRGITNIPENGLSNLRSPLAIGLAKAVEAIQRRHKSVPELLMRLVTDQRVFAYTDVIAQNARSLTADRLEMEQFPASFVGENSESLRVSSIERLKDVLSLVANNHSIYSESSAREGITSEETTLHLDDQRRNLPEALVQALENYRQTCSEDPKENQPFSITLLQRGDTDSGGTSKERTLKAAEREFHIFIDAMESYGVRAMISYGGESLGSYGYAIRYVTEEREPGERYEQPVIQNIIKPEFAEVLERTWDVAQGLGAVVAIEGQNIVDNVRVAMVPQVHVEVPDFATRLFRRLVSEKNRTPFAIAKDFLNEDAIAPKPTRMDHFTFGQPIERPARRHG